MAAKATLATATPLQSSYAVDPAFTSFLKAHPRQYGAHAQFTSSLPQETIAAWALKNASGVLVGYVWLEDRSDDSERPGLYWSVGVLDGYQGSGAGIIAMATVENEARRRGADELLAQVNGSEPESGLRVRRWLLRNGYVPLRRSNPWNARLTDDEYCEKDRFPVVLAKRLPAADAGVLP